MKVTKVREFKNGKISFNLDDQFLMCSPSVDGSWHACTTKRPGSQTKWDDSLVLIKDDVVQLIFNAPVNRGFMVHGVSMNGIVLVSLHDQVQNSPKSVFVLNDDGKVIYQKDTGVHLTSGAISEYGKYIALSFSGGRNKDASEVNQIQLINVNTSSIEWSVPKNNNNLYSTLEVLEPDGAVFVIDKGEPRLLEVF